MLEKLMKEIHNSGTLQPARLAKKLNTSPALIEMMLEDLERRGVIVQVASNCGDSCGGCSLAGDCSVSHPQGRLWLVRDQ